MPTSLLAPPLLSQLDRDGFAILPPPLAPLAPPQLDALCSSLAEAPSPGERGIYARRDVLDIQIVRQMCAEELGQIARQVLGGGVRPVRGIFFDKVPGANWKVPWHQDFSIAVREPHEIEGFGPWSTKDGVPHVQPPPQVLAEMLTTRLHLDACPRDNGPLRVLPGSHQGGRLSAGEIVGWRQQVEERVGPVGRGGILLMKPLILHAFSASESPSHRRVLHIEWAARELPAPLRWLYGWRAREAPRALSPRSRLDCT